MGQRASRHHISAHPVWSGPKSIATSHISTPRVEWAKEHKVIVFVLPAHTSHILQPLDIGCFGPLMSAYYKLCQLHLNNTRYDIRSLSSRAHSKALTVGNVVSRSRTQVYTIQPTCDPGLTINMKPQTGDQSTT